MFSLYNTDLFLRIFNLIPICHSTGVQKTPANHSFISILHVVRWAVHFWVKCVPDFPAMGYYFLILTIHVHLRTTPDILLVMWLFWLGQKLWHPEKSSWNIVIRCQRSQDLRMRSNGWRFGPKRLEMNKIFVWFGRGIYKRERRDLIIFFW